LSGPLGLSLAALLLVVVFALVTIPSLLVAAFGPGTGSSEPGEAIAKLVAEHEKSVKTSQDRFNGRSVFFRPPPKYVPPPPPPPEDERGPPPPPPPPAVPISYTGPSLKAIMGETAWFMPPTAKEPPLYLKVGETDPKSGVLLVSTNPPWSVHVSHKGGEYDVELFKKSWEPFFNGDASPLRSPVPGLLFMPQADSGGAGGAAAATPDAAADRISGRNVARPVPLVVEPNAKAEAGRDKEAAEEDAEAKEAADESGEKPTADEEEPAAEVEDDGEAPPETSAMLMIQSTLMQAQLPTQGYLT
jgi:hypothetical protein